MPKIKPTILGNLNGMILTTENTLLLRTKNYPNGGKFLITGTKKAAKGWCSQLTDIQTGKRVVKVGEIDSHWFLDEEIKKIKIN